MSRLSEPLPEIPAVPTTQVTCRPLPEIPAIPPIQVHVNLNLTFNRIQVNYNRIQVNPVKRAIREDTVTRVPDRGDETIKNFFFYGFLYGILGGSICYVVSNIVCKLADSAINRWEQSG